MRRKGSGERERHVDKSDGERSMGVRERKRHRLKQKTLMMSTK